MATIKQKKAFKETGVNGGNISQAMKVAGYSESVAKRTDKLTRTKGWEELMEKYLPDKLLGKRHQELLNKREHLTKNNNETHEIEVLDTGEPDTQAVSKGLDMAYKLKGKYAAEKFDHTLNPIAIYDNRSISGHERDSQNILPEKKDQSG